jgi:prepilin-type processing-associated H-X9-DG protein
MVTKSEIAICCGMFLLGIILLTGAMPKDAKAVVCRGNLKNLFQTVQLYADSNNGYLPPLITRKAKWEFWMHALLPYTKDARSFYCPANPRAQKILTDETDGERDLLPAVFDIGSTAYGMNIYLSSDGSKRARWRKLSEAATPAYTICIGDSALKRGYSLRPVRACWQSDYGPVHKQGVSMYTFLDGHVESFTKSTLGIAESFDGWKKDIKRWKNWKNK